MAPGHTAAVFRREWFLAVSLMTCVVFLLAGHVLLGNLANPILLGLVFLWLFVVVLGSALAVARHADRLAARLGEPYGTLILTLCVTSIEVVSISAVILHGANNPTLVRDTLFAVVMIILNGMVGLSLLLGGWRYGEQQYNLQGANAYLGVIIPLAVLSLILPNYTQTTAGPTVSGAQKIFLVVISVGLYVAFLAIQTYRHRDYFATDDASAAGRREKPESDSLPLAWRVTLLAAYLLPVVFLADQLAQPIDYVVETLRAPVALGGVAIAVLVATPEAIGATRAATANQLQRSVNIFLGSVLSTIGLTIPAMIIIGHVTGREIILGLQHTDFIMLLLTLAVCVVTFASGRTHVLQGAVHLILFAAYLLLIFQG